MATGQQRAVAIGVWMTGFSAGAAVGSMLEFFWWGSVFLMALPMMALLLVLGPRVLPEFRDPNAGRLDLLSAGLSLVAILAVIYGLKVTSAIAAVVAVGIAVFALVMLRHVPPSSQFQDETGQLPEEEMPEAELTEPVEEPAATTGAEIVS